MTPIQYLIGLGIFLFTVIALFITFKICMVIIEWEK